MKILILSHIFPPAIDGGSKGIWKLGEYLQKEGHQILALTSNCFSTDDFVTPNSKTIKNTPQSNTINHIPLIRLPVYKNLRKPLKALKLLLPQTTTLSQKLSLLQKGPFFKVLPFLKILPKVRTFKPDLIIAGPLPTNILNYALALKKITSSKLLISPCFHPEDPDFQHPLIFKLLSKADYLLSFTNYEKKQLSNRGVDPKKIIITPLGIDPDFILPKDKIKYPLNPNLLFIANFSAHKRAELLIEALEKLLPKYPHLTLTFLGQKTLYWPNIQNKLNSLPKDTLDHIKIHFSPTQKEIKKYIDSSTLLCLPSIHESFGMVLIESIARGKTILTTDKAQTQENAKNIHGHTFKSDDINDLVSKLDSLLSNPKLLKSSALLGHSTIKSNYTWDRIVKRILESIHV